MDRTILFWGVCIPLRLVIAHSATPPLRALAAGISYRWLAGLETGRVGFFGGPAWWADFRPLHGVLWGIFALSGDPRVLYIDAAVGAALWMKSR